MLRRGIFIHINYSFNILSDYFISNRFLIFEFIQPVEIVYFSFKINVHFLFPSGPWTSYSLRVFFGSKGGYSISLKVTVYKNAVKLCAGSYRSHTMSPCVTADV